MNNATQNIETKGKQQQSKRNRRHWYDDEKIEIISKYQRGELKKAAGAVGTYIDPKSGEYITPRLIESWKDQFRIRGLDFNEVKVKPEPNPPSHPMRRATDYLQHVVTSRSEGTLQSLLMSILLENQQLKEAVQTLRKKDYSS